MNNTRAAEVSTHAKLPESIEASPPVMKPTDFRHFVSGAFRRDHAVVNSVTLVVVLLIAAGSAGCADDPVRPTAEGPTLTGDITVFAAASLTEAFTELGERFEADHPGTRVDFNFGASSALVQQLIQGAPADVFASADQATMDQLVAADLAASTPVTFARNALTILVEDGNPEGIEGLADLAAPDLAVVLCAPQVPCGKYAAQVLAAAGISVTPRSLEENVKGVVTKVTIGEADAGIVYVTDAIAAGDETDRVDVPADQNAVATYPISSLAAAPNAEVADAFVDLVTGTEGRSALEDFGFTTP
jgi:molybdate transport system substrate-binding protein